MQRSRIDIIIDILDVVKIGASKTTVVYRANLNFALAKKYLGLLQKHGMVENKSGRYISTDRGKRFLDDAKKIVQQLEGLR